MRKIMWLRISNIYIEKYKIAYYNYTEAKCAHQVQEYWIYSNPVSYFVCLVKTTVHDQNNNKQ